MKYEGKRSEIDVHFPDGRSLSVAFGDEVEVSPDEAKALKNLPGWSNVASSPIATSPKED